MTTPCCGLAAIFCGFIPHLIGRETINIPDIFSGVHGFTGKTRAGWHLSQFCFSNFWQILAVVALDEHVLTKTSLIDMYVTRSTELTLRRYFPMLHVLASLLSSNE